MVQGRGSHAQCLSNSILAATGRSAQHFARAGFIIRTQAEPGTKVVSSFEGTQIIAEFSHQGNAGENADAWDGRQINAKEAREFFTPRPLWFILTGLLAPRFARPSDGLRAGYFRAQPHDLDRPSDSGAGFQLAGLFQQLLIPFLDLVLSLLPILPGHP